MCLIKLLSIKRDNRKKVRVLYSIKVWFVYFSVNMKVMKEPKNLFIGRCTKDDQLLHSENIVLLNDKKGQVNATIAVSIYR